MRKRNNMDPDYGHPKYVPQRRAYPRLFKSEGYIPLREQVFTDVACCDCYEINEHYLGNKVNGYERKGCATGQGKDRDEDSSYRMFPTKINRRGVCHYCGYYPSWPELSHDRREKFLELKRVSGV